MVGGKQVNKAKIGALIVTYNRCDYLMRLLEGLLQQTQRLDTVLIFDNSSTDGTPERLKEAGYITEDKEDTLNLANMKGVRFCYYRNSCNSGGSGGFYSGLKLASRLGFEYVWAMDDDVLPARDCLERMMELQDSETMMCVPNRTGAGFQDYAIVEVNLRNPFIASVDKWKKKILPQDIAGTSVAVRDMAFEGPLINTELIRKIGLPEKDLFILFDDSEYAMRASKQTRILFVKNAVLNKQIITGSGATTAKWKLYYHFRNAVWFVRKYGENWAVRAVRPALLCLYWGLKYLMKRDMSCLKLIWKAYRDGMGGKLGKNIEPQSF